MEKRCKQIGAILLSFLVSMTRILLVVPKGTCRFSPSCSEYASEAIRSFPFHKAIALIIKRLAKCTPFSHGGYDPVPEHQGKGCQL